MMATNEWQELEYSYCCILGRDGRDTRPQTEGRELSGQCVGFVQEIGPDNHLPAAIANWAAFMQECATRITMREDEYCALYRRDGECEQAADAVGRGHEEGGGAWDGQLWGGRVDVRVEVDEDREA